MRFSSSWACSCLLDRCFQLNCPARPRLFRYVILIIEVGSISEAWMKNHSGIRSAWAWGKLWNFEKHLYKYTVWKRRYVVRYSTSFNSDFYGFSTAMLLWRLDLWNFTCFQVKLSEYRVLCLHAIEQATGQSRRFGHFARPARSKTMSTNMFSHCILNISEPIR